MQLRTLLTSLSPLKFEGTPSAEVSGLAYNPWRVLPGQLYFALELPGADGHRQIETAVSRGAIGVVCRKNRAMRQRAAVIEVEDPRAALAEAAAVFYGRPAEKLRVLGVAPQAGGWKTAFLLKTILEASGTGTGLISSLRHDIGERRLPAERTLQALDIQKLFAEMPGAGCSSCALELPEVSPDGLRGIPLDLLIFDGRDQKEWWSLCDYLNHAHDRKPSCGIIGADSYPARGAAASVLFDALVTYGCTADAQVSAQDLSYSLRGTEGVLFIGRERVPFSVPLIGRDNLRYLVAACAAAFACDLSPEQIGEALASLPPLPGCLERVPSARGTTVFVDEARDERSIEALFRVLREITSRPIKLLLGQSEGTAGKDRFCIGRMVARFADRVVLTSDNPGREAVEQICSALAQGLESAGHTQYQFQPDRREAIRELLRMGVEDDILLICGKGERTWQELAGTVIPFDDRIVAAELCTEISPPRPRVQRRVLATV